MPKLLQLEADVSRLLAIAVVAGLGLLTVAIAHNIARDGSKWGEPVLWAGMFMLWVPSSVRIIGRAAPRSERIALLVLVGMGMYVVAILHSPRYFTGFDEFLHWRTANDMVHTGKVFNANPGLAVSPLYPGLEVATNAIRDLTGLSVVVAGRIVVAAARLIIILALYLLYEQVGRSSWLAGLATAAYFTNPQFLFFDSAYAYESLGLGLAVLVLYAVARGRVAHSRSSVRAAMLVVLPLAATAATHHITSFGLVIALVLVATVASFLEPSNTRLWLWGIALAGVGLVFYWLYLVAGQVINYLEPTVAGGVSQVLTLIRGEGASRHLFHNYVGPATPPVEQMASFAFAAITMLALPLAALRIWRTRQLDTFTVFFAFGSLLYPVSGLLHFTAVGAELGGRLFAFVFVPVAFCIAIAVGGRDAGEFSRRSKVALVLVGALLLYGGATIGTPAWLRLPGPYLVSADDRSIEAQGISASSWAGRFLPHNSRIAADRINTLLMMTYGGQWPVSNAPNGASIAPVFLTPQLTPYDLRLLRLASLRYIVVDYRLTRSLPWLSYYYYYSGESGTPTYRRPLPVADFKKFDGTQKVSRVFDSGDIAIFDVGGLARRG